MSNKRYVFLLNRKIQSPVVPLNTLDFGEVGIDLKVIRTNMLSKLIDLKNRTGNN